MFRIVRLVEERNLIEYGRSLKIVKVSARKNGEQSERK